jgi:hypothetical protein
MTTTAIVVPVTKEQVKNLAALDAWLENGPAYARNAAIGGVVGAAVGYFAAKKAKGSTFKFAALGAGTTIVGGFLLFQVGKWASKKEHDVLASAAVATPPPTLEAPVVTKGHFAGAPRALYPTVDAHHVYR